MDKIELSKEALDKTSEIHLMPCKISYDGECEVKSYFSNTIIHSKSPDGSDGYYYYYFLIKNYIM